MTKLKIITEYPQAYSSPDFLDPDGAINDNNSNDEFIASMLRLTNNYKFSILDLGCAGGQMVVDFHNRGHTSAGVEGSDKHVMKQVARGRENWDIYEDVCLFRADVTKPFYILDENDDLYRFNIITSWEFLEHPPCDTVPMTISNMKKHLTPNGIMLHMINTSPGWKHQCPQSGEWWDEQFKTFGFKSYKYPIQTTPRGYCHDGHLVMYRLT